VMCFFRIHRLQYDLRGPNRAQNFVRVDGCSHFIIFFFKFFFFFDSGPGVYYFLTRDPLFIIVDVRSNFFLFFFKFFFFFFFFFHSRTAHYHSRTAPSSFSDCALCKWRTQLMYANGA
jgi:hypothetical protein